MNLFIIVLVIGAPLAFLRLMRPRHRGTRPAGTDGLPATIDLIDKSVSTAEEAARALSQSDWSGLGPKELCAEAARREESPFITQKSVAQQTEGAIESSCQVNPQVNISDPPSDSFAVSDEERSGAGQTGMPTSNNAASVLLGRTVMESTLPDGSPRLSRTEIDYEENFKTSKAATLGRTNGAEPVVAVSGTSRPVVKADGEGANGSSETAEEPRVRTGESRNGEQAEIIPLRYRSPSQRPPRHSGQRGAEKKTKETELVQSAAMEIRLRLTFDRFGFASLGFLAERSVDLDEEIEVTDGKAYLQLVAQESWYQDLQFVDAGKRMRRGIELHGVLSNHRPVRWRLSGRDIYVMAGHSRVNGFISTSRLMLGRTDVVLCADAMVSEVEAILVEAGCGGYSKFGEAQGLPAGWAGFRGVLPSKALALGTGSDPFYALKPAPEIHIELEGGVCVRNSEWLAGYPPRIKLLGGTGGIIRVLIDGQEAQHSPEGSLVADGYDLVGEHSVYCEGLSCSRTYSIGVPEESWEEWAAHSFSEADMCGPFVQIRSDAVRKFPFSVPMSNPLLIGTEVGQLFRCSPRKAANWEGFVPFPVAWALPAQPLTCDKKTARILQYSSKLPVIPEQPAKSEVRWCNAIMDAARKGLVIGGTSEDSSTCWAEYKKVARSIRRGRR